jgi:hypothetical protein
VAAVAVVAEQAMPLVLGMPPVLVGAPSVMSGHQEELPGQPLRRSARGGAGGRRPVEKGPHWI